MLDQAATEARPIAVVFVDIANFRALNDQFGHLEGDKILKRLGKRFGAAVGSEAFAMRVSGNIVGAAIVGKSYRDTLALALGLRERLLSDQICTVNIGFATFAVTASTEDNNAAETIVSAGLSQLSAVKRKRAIGVLGREGFVGWRLGSSIERRFVGISSVFPFPPKTYELPPNELLKIGRDSDCDVPLIWNDDSVSRRHALVRRRADGCWLVDLDSLNGTFVNGERIQETRLRPQDTIRLGTCPLRFDDCECLDAGNHENVTVERLWLGPMPRYGSYEGPGPGTADRAT